MRLAGDRRRFLRGLPAVAALLAGRRAAAAAPLPVEEVAAGIFVHRGAHEDFSPENRGGLCNIGFVVGARSVAVIDTGGSFLEGQDLLRTIRMRTDLPIAWVIATHVHPDHMLGHGAFVETGARFLGHRRLPAAVATKGPLYLANMERLLGPAYAGTVLVPPEITVAEDAPLELDLGGRTLRLEAWPTAHTDTDLTVLDTATGTLFAGDLLFMERLPVVDGSIKGWLGLMDRLAAIPAGHVVPGHGPPIAPWPAALTAERTYLQDLATAVRAAIRRGASIAEAEQAVPLPEGQAWLLTETNHPRNVLASWRELEWE